MISDIKTFTVNELATNCYVFSDELTKRYAIVDPGGRTEELDSYLETVGENLDYILLTHGHFDHIASADFYREKYGCKIVIFKDDAEFLQNGRLNLSDYFGTRIKPFNADILLADGEYIMLGESKISVMHTPGHTKGSCCYISGNIIFSGDTMFASSYGRTDFPTGNSFEMAQSLKKLVSLDKNYTVYPGHGALTTIMKEKTNDYEYLY